MSTSRSVSKVLSEIKPSLLVCDFDASISQHDTIVPLLQLAKRHYKSPQTQENIDRYASAYTKKYRALRQELIIKLNNYVKKTPKNELSFLNINTFFQQYDANEVDALEELNRNELFLANIPKLEVQNTISQSDLMPNALKVLSDFSNIKSNIDKRFLDKLETNVKIISSHWSREVIYYALNQTVRYQDIYCNILGFTTKGISDGYIDPNIVTSMDKSECLQQLRDETKSVLSGVVSSLNPVPPKPTINLVNAPRSSVDVVFIGDSELDIIAGLHSDLFLLMENEYNQDIVAIFRDNSDKFDNVVIVNEW